LSNLFYAAAIIMHPALFPHVPAQVRELRGGLFLEQSQC